MSWNRKWMGVCLAAFVVLVSVLAVKGFWPGAQPETDNGIQTGLTSSQETPPSTTGSAVTETDGKRTADGTEDKEDSSVKSKDGKKDTSTGGRTEAKTQKTKKATPSPKENKQEKASSSKSSRTGKYSKSQKKDRDKTDKNGRTSVSTPAPAATRAPAVSEPKQTEPAVSFQIICTAIMDKRDMWREGIETIVPSNGVFYTGTVSIQKGDTVYDVLKKVCKENNLALDSQYTPIYGSYYIQGIGHLYEFDCGGNSGWRYSVNGTIPGEGCSSYTVQDGDAIVFFYDYQY
ncbi:MAG: DUF4430 domain-containing protein [Lachnospiraceae bacterium]|nr:DUF4430 domain-containing protein [Lachnospiraceae bacterium]